MSGYVTSDRQRYGSDMYFAGGEGKGINPPDTPADERIEVGASDARLYGSFREGQFSYRVPVPDGKYKIVLHFTEHPRPQRRESGCSTYPSTASES